MIKKRRSISFLNSNLRNKVTKMLGHEPFEKVNNLAILIKLVTRTTNNLNCAWKVSVNFQKLLSSDSSYILHIFTGYFLYQNYIFMQKCNKKNIPFAIFHSITWFSMVCRRWQTFFHLNEIHFMIRLSLIVLKIMILHILIWFSGDVEYVYLTMIWFPDEKGVTNEKELDALSN